MEDGGRITLAASLDPALADEGRTACALILAGPLDASEPAPDWLSAELDAAIAAAALSEGSPGRLPPSGRSEAVRALLRRLSYKPSGRGKPASEYLAQAAREGRFPRISALVDLNNLVSLRSGLPASILDIRPFLTEGGSARALIRPGQAGESYVFNQAGQSIELEDLLCLCGGPDERPLGNAVKDSLEAKLSPETRSVIVCLYAPAELASVAEAEARDYAEALGKLGGEGFGAEISLVRPSACNSPA